jgi:hypothetical protein
MREERRENPEPSSYKPKALRERTIQEAKVLEFGPVTFGAYQGATAGVRSLTGHFASTASAEWLLKARGFVGQREYAASAGSTASCAVDPIRRQLAATNRTTHSQPSEEHSKHDRRLRHQHLHLDPPRPSPFPPPT